MRRLVALGAVATALAVAAALAVTSSGRGAHPVPASASTTAPDTVRVVRGSITEVTTFPAQVIVRPRYYLRAPAAGPLRLSHRIRAGADVGAGELLGTTGRGRLTAPGSGVVTRVLIPEGSQAEAGIPVLELTYQGFGEQARVPPEAAYHILVTLLSARADITGGPGPFDCPLVEQPLIAAVDEANPEASGPPVLCLIPTKVRAYSGLTGTIAVKSRQANDVLVLPVTAVAGRAESGQVVLLQAGKRTTRQVVLGATNGASIEIMDGLAEGDTVLARGPDFFEQAS
jgi:hypothetical protein